MPFDGIITKFIIEELNSKILFGRIDKIHQPEKDEINITLRSKGKNLKLLLSIGSNYPRIHLTNVSKKNPDKAPLFCMILRKHLTSSKITAIKFMDYERIIKISFENTTDLGEISIKNLIIEIMGRHSNIILTNNNNKIIDSVKHIDFEISSKREIMPARDYLLPPSQNKISPDKYTDDILFTDNFQKLNTMVFKFILDNIKGLSPLICNEICYMSNINPKNSVDTLTQNQIDTLKKNINYTIKQITNNKFRPVTIYSNNKPLDFHCLNFEYKNKILKHHDTMSDLLDEYYYEVDKINHLNQKKYHIQKTLQNNINRCTKKISIHDSIIRKSANTDKYRLYGELITANIYNMKSNIKKIKLLNYYSTENEYVDISLKPTLTPNENAQFYYKKYSKSKTAIIESKKQVELAKSELYYLESVFHNLEIASEIEEINEIKEELVQQNYLIDKKKSKKKILKISKPHHYISSNGYDIFVGKNNVQNDILTLKSSQSNDIWLHTKDIHGSHVIIKTNNSDFIPDKTLVEAANLSAFYSKGKLSSKVPVDYTKVKNVKKPSGAKPGMVIYVNYKTIYITPHEELIKNLTKE
ncbi:MAG: NFACT RNA binding domain-containing protein [Clostridiales bacterium]